MLYKAYTWNVGRIIENNLGKSFSPAKIYSWVFPTRSSHSRFKTVQLSDLTLEEMKFFILQYKKLLDDGVYGKKNT